MNAYPGGELTERRRAPRFEVSLVAQAETPQGALCDCHVSNISSSGLQLIFAQSCVPLLLPNLSNDNSLEPVRLSLCIHLPKENAALLIQAGIVYLRRQSVDRCVVGCRFEVFHQDSAERLQAYLSRLQPAHPDQ